MSVRSGQRPGRKRVRYRTTPLGRCWIVSCKRRALRDTIRCQFHLDQAVAANKRTRDYRRLLGFCKYCRERAEPGYSRCQKHLDVGRAAHQRYRDRGAKQRGWKWMKVKV